MGAGAVRREAVLWCRRPDQRAFLDVRLGSGTLPSRNEIELPRPGEMSSTDWDELVGIKQRYAMVGEVPVVASLSECGSLGIAGPRQAALGSARAVIAGLLTLHSPAELVLVGVASTSAARDWDWLK